MGLMRLILISITVLYILSIFSRLLRSQCFSLGPLALFFFTGKP